LAFSRAGGKVPLRIADKRVYFPMCGRFSPATSPKRSEQMNLNDYFKEKNGTGVLSTADAEGRVDAAIYARPHVFADGSVAFLMRQRLTYRNMQSNPHAA